MTTWILVEHICYPVHILKSLEFNNRKEASERASLENRMGEYKGRGVKAIKRSDYYK